MTTQDAYRAGFMLKCASLGLSSEFAQFLFNHSGMTKCGVLGAAAGLGFNALTAAGRGSAKLLDKSRAVGDSLARPMMSGRVPQVSGIPDDALKSLLLSAYYERANQALLTPHQ